MCKHRTFLLFILFFTVVNLCHSNRILAVFPFNAKSHNVMFDPLIDELCKRGHQVDVITHFPLKNTSENCKIIINLDGTMDSLVNNFTIDYTRNFKYIGINLIAEKFGNSICHNILALDTTQKLIKNPPKNPPYDLVLVEAFEANCFFGFGHLLQVPVVAVSSAIEYPWISSFIGNDDNLAYVVTPSLSIFEKMTFWERLQNFYIHNKEQYIYQSLTEKSQTDAMRKYLSPNTPSIRDVEKSVALTLVNSHPIIFGVKPITPTLVQVGGLQIGRDQTKPSKELQQWMDDSSHGFIYFTFGSMVLIESLPASRIKNIFKTFANIAPIRILMKIADKQKLPPGLPSNILTSPWIPQEAVLVHKNVRLFITHGGLMGTQEALYYGIPTIGVPLFADQYRNVAALVAKNMSIKLGLDDLNNDVFGKTVNTILSNPNYRSNAKLYSKLFRDRPISAMDTAIFWIEYVIRNGPSVLRSRALDLRWFELAQLDIYTFVLASVAIGLLAIYYLTKLFVRNFIFRCQVKVKVS